MNELVFLARLRNAPTALERFIGLVRRRAFALERLSVSAAGDGTWEICLRFDGARTLPDRVCAEVENLVDVLSLERLPQDGGHGTRELVLARLKPGDQPGPEWRKVSQTPEGAVVEFTGSPVEIEAALAALGAQVRAVVRSGELVVPSGNQLKPTEANS